MFSKDGAYNVGNYGVGHGLHDGVNGVDDGVTDGVNDGVDDGIDHDVDHVVVRRSLVFTMVPTLCLSVPQMVPVRALRMCSIVVIRTASRIVL